MPSRTTTATATAAVDDGKLRRAVGQRVITPFGGTSPDATILRLARQGKIGGIILFGPNIVSVRQVRAAVDRLQRAARAGGNPPLLITVDQEGGLVKRFGSLPPTVSPREQNTVSKAARQGRSSAVALQQAGVNVNLAPVADVTNDPDSFLYSRSYPRPEQVCAFAQASRKAGVIPVLKHFPGLGGAPANTDDAGVTLHASRSTLVKRAAAYRRCGTTGLVMVNSARYSALGDGPALLRPETYALLKRTLGLPNVLTISDSLQAQALVPYRNLYVRAVRAGLDLLLSTGSEATAEGIYTAVYRAARSGALDAGEVIAGAERIRRLKAGLT